VKTYLQIIQQAQMELGLPVSTTVEGNSDATTVQMGALANRVLDELRRMNRWTAMQFEFDLAVPPAVATTGNMAAGSAVITNIPSTAQFASDPQAWAISGTGLLQAARIATVDSATQVTMNMENTNTDAVTGADILFGQDTFAMPSGFDWYNNRTMWDRTNRWELLGPDSPQLDQWHRSGIIAVGPRRHFRQLGPFADKFRLWPAPFEITQPLQLVFEFLSINAVSVEGSATNFAQYFENDTDVPLLDDQSIIMGIKWMFWEIKGFGSYVTAQSRWIDYVKRQIARDGAAPTLTLARPVEQTLLSSNQVQDGFFPGPSGSS
jgi:hypothetical protein